MPCVISRSLLSIISSTSVSFYENSLLFLFSVCVCLMLSWNLYTHAPPSCASLPLPHPTSLGHQGALRWAPCVTQLLLTCYLFYTILFMSVSFSPFVLFSPPPLPSVHESALYICISTPVLQIGSSEQLSLYTTPSFSIPYICIIYDIYFSLSDLLHSVW